MNEDLLEQAYSNFDAERQRTGAERDAFKHQMRKFAREETAAFLLLLQQAELYVRAYMANLETPEGKGGASRTLRTIEEALENFDL